MSVQLLPAGPHRFEGTAGQEEAFRRRDDEETGAQKQAAVIVAGMLVSLYFHYLHAANLAQGADDTRTVRRAGSDSRADSVIASRADDLAYEAAKSQGESIRLIARVFQDHLIEQGQADGKAAIARSLVKTAERAQTHKQQADHKFNDQWADLQVAVSRTRRLPVSAARPAPNLAIAAAAVAPPRPVSGGGTGSVAALARK